MPSPANALFATNPRIFPLAMRQQALKTALLMAKGSPTQTTSPAVCGSSSARTDSAVLCTSGAKNASSHPYPVIQSSGKHSRPCLLYTSDAADEEDSVDLGGRRII